MTQFLMGFHSEWQLSYIYLAKDLLFYSPFALPPNPLKGEPPPRNAFFILTFACFNLLRTAG